MRYRRNVSLQKQYDMLLKKYMSKENRNISNMIEQMIDTYDNIHNIQKYQDD